jgi:O-antigen ligase
MHATPAQRLGWYLWLLLIILSPANTKLAGAAWVLAIVASFWLAYRYPKLPAESAETAALYRATHIILWSVSIAFVLRTIGQAYWWDNWTYRHFDVRMVFTAIALHIVVRRFTLPQSMRNELLIAIALASLSALYVTYPYLLYIHEPDVPTSIIPWAFGMVLFSMVLASPRTLPNQSTGKNRFVLNVVTTVGALLLLGAVLIAGVRGAYFGIAWVLIVIVLSLKHTLPVKHLKGKNFWLSCLGICVLAGIVVTNVPQLYDIPQKRITKALNEINHFKANERGTSIGLRLHFLEKGVDSFMQNPVLGVGIKKRIELVDQWSVEAKFPFRDMTHTHNEYLNSILDYGVLGGVATLAYLLGILLAATVLIRTNFTLSLTLAGIFFAILTTFFTNTNTLHNYTSVTLGLALIYSILLYSERQRSQPPPITQPQ